MCFPTEQCKDAECAYRNELEVRDALGMPFTVFATLCRHTLKRVKCPMTTQGFNGPLLLWILFHLPATNGSFIVPGPELLDIVHKCVTLNTEVNVYARKSSPFNPMVL